MFIIYWNRQSYTEKVVRLQYSFKVNHFDNSVKSHYVLMSYNESLQPAHRNLPIIYYFNNKTKSLSR